VGAPPCLEAGAHVEPEEDERGLPAVSIIPGVAADGAPPDEGDGPPGEPEQGPEEGPPAAPEGEPDGEEEQEEKGEKAGETAAENAAED